MTRFTFGTARVNNLALHLLMGPKSLLHRSTPFSDFREVSKAAEASIPSLEQTFGPFVDATHWDTLHPRVKQAPFYSEGQVLFQHLAELVDGVFNLYPWCSNDVLIDPSISEFFKRIKSWSMYANHPAAKRDENFFGLYIGEKLRCTGVRKWLTTQLFHVTGYHRHVGTVADTFIDPDFATWSWKPMEAHGTPRHHVQLSLIST